MKPFFMEVMDDETADFLRQRTEVERLKIANQMWKSARVILRGAIRTEHPEWNVDQVNREIARRISLELVTDDWTGKLNVLAEWELVLKQIES